MYTPQQTGYLHIIINSWIGNLLLVAIHCNEFDWRTLESPGNTAQPLAFPPHAS